MLINSDDEEFDDVDDHALSVDRPSNEIMSKYRLSTSVSAKSGGPCKIVSYYASYHYKWSNIGHIGHILAFQNFTKYLGGKPEDFSMMTLSETITRVGDISMWL